MHNNQLIKSPLAGRTVALAETRQLDVLANMFEKRGAVVQRVPLVAILDSPDQGTVESWLDNFIQAKPVYLVILTGEGIRRLVGFAERAGCLAEFVSTLSQVTKVCRGPKPARALKEIGLDADLNGKEPTTAGIIETLGELPLDGASVAVQLYGSDPNKPLMDYLQSRHVEISTVSPYIYAYEIDTEKVQQLIEQLVEGSIDIIAFTSKAQVTRIFKVAKTNDSEAKLLTGLEKTLVAAVGPVVADELADQKVKVDVCPEHQFFMKPMLREIERRLTSTGKQ